MKKSLIFVGMLSIGYAYAQTQEELRGRIGLNTASPNATLEVKVAGINASNDTNQGVLIPKLTKTRVAGIADSKLVKGTLVFVEGTTYSGTNAKVTDINGDGFYYYNGTKWAKVEGDKVVDATADKGLVRAGSGTHTEPYTLGIANRGVKGDMIDIGQIDDRHIVYWKGLVQYRHGYQNDHPPVGTTIISGKLPCSEGISRMEITYVHFSTGDVYRCIYYTGTHDGGAFFTGYWVKNQYDLPIGGTPHEVENYIYVVPNETSVPTSPQIHPTIKGAMMRIR